MSIQPIEPSAHMFPSDLEKFKESETFATAFSVEVGSPDGRSVPLFTLDGRLGNCAKVCEGIPDDALKSWLNPPEGQLGAPHGTWAAQLAEVGRQQVEMQMHINALLSVGKALVERWDTPLWKHVPATAEYIGALRTAIAKAEGQA